MRCAVTPAQCVALVLLNPHNSTPPAPPPQIVLGITSAGEGITFMMLWTFAGQFGLLGTDYTFQKAVSVLMRGFGCLFLFYFCNPHFPLFLQVFYTSFFPVFCSPPILWAARSPPPLS